MFLSFWTAKSAKGGIVMVNFFPEFLSDDPGSASVDDAVGEAEKLFLPPSQLIAHFQCLKRSFF